MPETAEPGETGGVLAEQSSDFGETEGAEAPSDGATGPTDGGTEDAFLREIGRIDEAAPPAADLVGARLGRFRVEAFLDKGGMGVVYRAVDEALRREVALKVLPPGFVHDEKRRRLFLREARSAAAVSHPSIATIFEIGEAEGGRIYIAMELVRGKSLRAVLEERRPTVAEVLRIARGILDGVGKAHEAGLVHRDLKPDNVMLTGEGGVKVLDFGLATALSQARTEETLGLATTVTRATAGGRAVGTPGYMSPEQARGEAVDQRSDVFSFGAMLYEMLAGQRAFSGSTTADVTAAVLRDEPEPVSKLNPEVPAELSRIVERCLAKEAAQRYGDCRSLAGDLDGVIGSAAAPPAKGPAAGERRVCTVMLVDVMGARRVVSHLDPEDARDIVDRAFSAAREQVIAMGGVFEELPGGDQAMAVFGIPRATDNDAERAVLSALHIQAAIARVALPRALRKARLSARIGVSTGRVFAEPASAARPRLTVLGEAADTAAALQKTAPEGAIVIGRDTYRLVVSLFETEPLAPVEGLPIYRVVRAIASRPVAAPADFHGVDTRLVGRETEMRRLADALDTTLEERRAGLVTLVGAAGIGRSRVLADFFASLRDREEVLVMAAQGSPLLSSTSYGLAAAMLRRSFAILDNDEAGVVRRKLRRGLRWIRIRSVQRCPDVTAKLDRAEIDDAVDQIAGILGAGTADQTRPGSMALAEETGPAKQRISAAAACLLRLVSGAAPIVMICDDLQWADGASLDLLDHLLLRAEDLPVLAVCAARPDLLERRPAWGEDKAAHMRVEIAPLPRRHVEEMVRDRLRRVPDLSPAVVRTLADRAEGNPLILVEMLHLLVDAGVIEVRGEEPWGLREEKLGALALPATVQGIVQARLDRLEAAPRTLLAQAAVVGRTFWTGALEQMQEHNRSGGVAALPAGVLAQLRERQLVRPREPAMFPGEHEYVFSESVIQEVAYETSSVKVRRPLHLVVARWLEARDAGGAGTALVALHYDRAGDSERAAAAYVRAAGYAVSLGENAQARSLLERARDIDDEALESASGGEALEEREGVLSWQDAIRLRLDLGDVLRRLGLLDEAVRTLEEARARLPGRLDTEARAGLPGRSDTPDARRFDARIDHRLALVHRVRGAMKEAIPLVERAIARAREAGAVEETPAMYALLAVLHRRERRIDASIEAALAGLRVCRAEGQRGDRRRADVGQLLCGLGNALYARGRVVGAERSYRQALRSIHEATNPHLAAIAYNGIAGVRYGIARSRGSAGDFRVARDMVLRSLRLKERVGDLHQIAVAYSNLVEIDLAVKDVPAALDHGRRAVEIGERIGAGYDLAEMYRNLAEARLASGDVEGALEAGHKALSRAAGAGRIYLGGAALALAKASAGAAAPGREALRAQAIEGAGALRKALREALSKYEEDEALRRRTEERDALRRRAEECEAVLAAAGIPPG